MPMDKICNTYLQQYRCAYKAATSAALHLHLPWSTSITISCNGLGRSKSLIYSRRGHNSVLLLFPIIYSALLLEFYFGSFTFYYQIFFLRLKFTFSPPIVLYGDSIVSSFWNLSYRYKNSFGTPSIQIKLFLKCCQSMNRSAHDVIFSPAGAGQVASRTTFSEINSVLWLKLSHFNTNSNSK